ncbi:MAG: alpha/beta hydrolase-fold protein [Ignavibacteria bacterium]
MKNYFILLIFLLTTFCSMDKNMQQKNTESLFNDFLEKINNTDNPGEKKELTESFLQDVKSAQYPLFENDTTYILLYKGDQDSAGVLGDMTNWVETLWMTKIEGTDLFYYKGNAEPDARLEYWLMFNNNPYPAIDSFNEYKVLNGLGELSELAMPQYKRHPYFDSYIHGEKGSAESLVVHEIDSEFLGYSHTIHVYLPPGYNSEEKYPVFYLQDGIDYVEFAQVPVTLNNLINENKIKPLITVFVTPPNRLKPDFPNRMSEYGLNKNYVKFFADELVSFIDKNYSTITEPEHRLVAGDSFGGLISAYIPFARPDVFANGYSQSGYQSFKKDQLINSYKFAEKKDIKLYVDTGLYERMVGASFLPKDEIDFLMANRRFKKVLQEKGYDFVYREYPEGHTWGNWRRHLIDALIYFFEK